MTQWYMVFRRDTGEAYSIGTQIADPMPPEFDFVAIGETDLESLMRGESHWDAASRKVLKGP